MHRSDAAPLLGLGFFWFSLYSSPYYPFTLSPAYTGTDTATISAQHTVYSFMLIAFFLALIVFRRQATHTIRSSTTVVVAGTAGTFGSALLSFAPESVVPGLMNGASLALVALYVAVFLIGWFSCLGKRDVRRIALIASLSHCIFGIAWAILLTAGYDALRLFSVACPALSATCLYIASSSDSDEEVETRHDLAALKAFPWGIVALCAVFTYFGVIAVRIFTAMGLGDESIGNLGVAPQAATALVGAALAGLLAALFFKKDVSLSSTVIAFSLLTFVYMASLLMVNLGNDSDGIALMGKRILVAAEHEIEVLLLIVLAAEVVRRRLTPILAFSAFGIFICVIPQFIALDLMYRSGLSLAVSRLSLATPAAAIGVFGIAAAGMGLLVWFSSRTASNARIKGDAWQQDLCRRAMESHDLTKRELDVVTYVYRGYTAKRIAEALMVSESTIKAHLSHVYRKTGIHSRQQLIALIDEFRRQ